MAEKKKKNQEEDDSPSAPAWMATFSDMMTLLMCFFILIMSFSTMELDKFKMAMGSLKGAFGVIGTQKRLSPDQSWFSPSPNRQELVSIFENVQQLREVIRDNEIEDRVDIIVHQGEVLLKINDNMLFDSGNAILKPNYLKLLNVIATTLFHNTKDIRVEGHTDNVPINTNKFPSNWELSMARAMNVVRYFVKNVGIDPGKISAAGYGEFRPIAPNDTPEGRAKNRRVIIRIKV